MSSMVPRATHQRVSIWSATLLLLVASASTATAQFKPRIIQEANSGIVMSLVSVGMGVGIVSSAMKWRVPQGVVLKTVADLSIPSCLDLIWRRDNASAVLERFADGIRSISTGVKNDAHFRQ